MWRGIPFEVLRSNPGDPSSLGAVNQLHGTYDTQYWWYTNTAGIEGFRIEPSINYRCVEGVEIDIFHTTKNRDHPVKWTDGRFRVDKRRYFTQYTISLWNLLPKDVG